MSAPDFMTCPSCKSRTWEDMLALGDEKDTMRFRCRRCGHVVKLGACRDCGTSDWQRRNDVHEKDGKRPVVRYQCSGCKRLVGIVLDQVD